MNIKIGGLRNIDWSTKIQMTASMAPPTPLIVPSILMVVLSSILGTNCLAQPPRVLDRKSDRDLRLDDLRNLNSYFPFQPVESVEDWPERRKQIRHRILVSQGLWPTPTKADLNAVIHGVVERDDYIVERVFFESIPGHYVTGSLYRPKNQRGRRPAILSPHGHWADGRFYQASEAQVAKDLKSGAEQLRCAAAFPIQARAVQLARMGCIVFVYDMTGNADSIQIGHRPDRWKHLDNHSEWGFFSAQAELRLQNMMGLQTWNSIRAVDFLLELPDVDPNRIGVTGASGGGTQSMILGAIDERISAAMPCVMVSTSMQGGCTCENAPYMRIDQGNVDIAAAIAPRPLGLTAADDWTRELKSKGYPELRDLYERLGVSKNLTANFRIEFQHNYNMVNRQAMYSFFNQHFELGCTNIREREFEPLTRDEATVWSGEHAPPSGDQVGDKHETRILKLATQDSEASLQKLEEENPEQYRNVIRGGWEILIGRTWDDVGDVTFESVKKSTVEKDIPVQHGLISAQRGQEKLPATVIGLPNTNKPLIVWFTGGGRSDVWNGGTLNAAVSQHLQAGGAILTVDVLGQGELSQDGQVITRQPMWYQGNGDAGWQKFSGYTYGYNHSLFACRVHDLLSTIKYARSQSNLVVLVASGEMPGTIGLAATAFSGDGLARAFVGNDGFKFDSVIDQANAMFVPGAVKYAGIRGLRELCNPTKIDWMTGNFDAGEVVKRVIGSL